MYDNILYQICIPGCLKIKEGTPCFFHGCFGKWSRLWWSKTIETHGSHGRSKYTKTRVGTSFFKVSFLNLQMEVTKWALKMVTKIKRPNEVTTLTNLKEVLGCNPGTGRLRHLPKIHEDAHGGWLKWWIPKYFEFLEFNNFPRRFCGHRFLRYERIIYYKSWRTFFGPPPSRITFSDPTPSEVAVMPLQFYH